MHRLYLLSLLLTDQDCSS